MYAFTGSAEPHAAHEKPTGRLMKRSVSVSGDKLSEVETVEMEEDELLEIYHVSTKGK
jgi:hypothetical protein